MTPGFKVGDIVRDNMRAEVGKVWGGGPNTLDLQNSAGYTWRALANRCELVGEAPQTAPRFPPHTRPESVTPEEVRVGDWVRLEDGRAYEVKDMRSSGPGGRVSEAHHMRGVPDGRRRGRVVRGPAAEGQPLDS